MALKIEAQGVFEKENLPVLYCGLGKVNAGIALTRRLSEYRHANQAMPLVLNFGTAGSNQFKTGNFVSCNSFIQRDMDVSGLGFARGVTPFEEIPSHIAFPTIFRDLPQAVCGSGDSFETQHNNVAYTVVDMEAYALAKVCWIEKARFASVKYITDGADQSAGSDWQSNLHKAADGFLKIYQSLK